MSYNTSSYYKHVFMTVPAHDAQAGLGKYTQSYEEHTYLVAITNKMVFLLTEHK